MSAIFLETCSSSFNGLLETLSIYIFWCDYTNLNKKNSQRPHAFNYLSSNIHNNTLNTLTFNVWSLISVVVAMPIITALQRGRPSPSVPPLHDAPSNHVIHRCLIQDASSDGGKKQKVICNFIQCKSMKRRPRYTHTQLHLKVEKEKIKYFLFYSLSFSLKIPFVWKKYIIKYWRNIR